MASISTAINRCLVFLIEPIPDVGKAGISGFQKLVARGFLNGGFPTARDASLLLTREEQSALFSGGRRWIVRQAGRIFLVGAVLTFARRLIFGGEENTTETRLQIIGAHIVKSGPLWAKAAGIGEQLFLMLTDDVGEAIADVAAGIFANWDGPQPLPPGARYDTRGYYHELLTPVPKLEEQVDTVIEAPGFLLQPGFPPAPDPQAVSFPSGPRPSFGRRH